MVDLQTGDDSDPAGAGPTGPATWRPARLVRLDPELVLIEAACDVPPPPGLRR